METSKKQTCQTCQTCNAFVSQRFKLLEFSSEKVVCPVKKEERLVFIMSGMVSLRTEEQEEFICEAGQMILLIREKRYEMNTKRNTRLLVLAFSEIHQICEHAGFENIKLLHHTIQYKFSALPIKKPMCIILKSVLLYLKDNISCDHWQKAKLLEFFVIFWNYYTIEEICHFFYPIIHKEIEFHSKVIINRAKAKTVIELAELCGYKLSTFNKIFPKHFQGASPYQWMQQQNAPLIKARLLDTTTPIKAVLAEFGFTDQSYFNTYCKRNFGATAYQIRKNNGQPPSS